MYRYSFAPPYLFDNIFRPQWNLLSDCLPPLQGEHQQEKPNKASETRNYFQVESLYRMETMTEWGEKDQERWLLSIPYLNPPCPLFTPLPPPLPNLLRLLLSLSYPPSHFPIFAFSFPIVFAFSFLYLLRLLFPFLSSSSSPSLSTPSSSFLSSPSSLTCLLRRPPSLSSPSSPSLPTPSSSFLSSPSSPSLPTPSSSFLSSPSSPYLSSPSSLSLSSPSSLSLSSPSSPYLSSPSSPYLSSPSSPYLSSPSSFPVFAVVSFSVFFFPLLRRLLPCLLCLLLSHPLSLSFPFPDFSVFFCFTLLLLLLFPSLSLFRVLSLSLLLRLLSLSLISPPTFLFHESSSHFFPFPYLSAFFPLSLHSPPSFSFPYTLPSAFLKIFAFFSFLLRLGLLRSLLPYSFSNFSSFSFTCLLPLFYPSPWPSPQPIVPPPSAFRRRDTDRAITPRWCVHRASVPERWRCRQ